jgi:hypothetical protein
MWKMYGCLLGTFLVIWSYFRAHVSIHSSIYLISVIHFAKILVNIFQVLKMATTVLLNA